MTPSVCHPASRSDKYRLLSGCNALSDPGRVVSGAARDACKHTDLVYRSSVRCGSALYTRSRCAWRAPRVSCQGRYLHVLVVLIVPGEV